MMDRITQTFGDGVGVVFDRVNAGVLFLDGERNILYANSRIREMLDLRGEDVDGRRWPDRFPALDRAIRMAEHEEEHAEVTCNGSVRHLVLSGSALGNDIYIKIIHEITRILSEIEAIREELTDLRELVHRTIGDPSFVPVCCVCKKIRMADGSWMLPADPDEVLSSSGLTHTYCPHCARELLSSYRKLLGERNPQSDDGEKGRSDGEARLSDD